MKRAVRSFPFNSILIIALWAALVACVDWARPLYYSTEEMHYASIAWEMWQHHHFILPIQGGAPYAEKGPLLFWLIHLGWWLFGVSTAWLRLAPALFGLATLWMVRKLSKQLWPNEPAIADLAPFILLGSFFFAAKIPVARFDVITTFFVVWALSELIAAIQNSSKYWLLFAVSMALGLLTKGPVLFLFILPAAILAKWWALPVRSWRSNYLYMIGALILSVGLVCCWLVPALLQGGPEYTRALLWARSVGRIGYGQSYLHQNWVYYVFILAMMLLPWLIWLPFWRAIVAFLKDSRHNGIEKGVRFLLMVMGCAFICLTFIENKAPRYILPALPFAAVLITFLVVKYTGPIRKSANWLIALSYIVVGVGYALLPAVAPLKIHDKYPWLVNVSSLWGCGIVLIGLFWLLWRTTDLKTLAAGLALSTVLFWGAYHCGVTKAQAGYGDWRMLGQQVASFQRQGIPVAFAVPYQELEFFGRLAEPMPTLTPKQIGFWFQQHPNGWVVVTDYKISPMQLRLISSRDMELPK